MIQVSTFLQNNPWVILSLTAVTLWPVLKAVGRACSGVLRFITHDVGRGAGSHKLAAEDMLFYVSHMAVLFGFVVTLEVLYLGFFATFPQTFAKSIWQSTWQDGLIVVPALLVRVVQVLLIADGLTMSLAVRSAREDRQKGGQ